MESSAALREGDPELDRIERAYDLLGVQDTAVRRGRPQAGIPWAPVIVIAVLGAMVFTFLNPPGFSFGSLVVAIGYAVVITLLLLVVLRSALAVGIEYPVLGWVVAVGGVVLVAVYWQLVHFMTNSESSLWDLGFLWRSLLLAVLGAVAVVAVLRKDSGTREWLAAPLRARQVAIVGYPPEPEPAPKTSWKPWLRNPCAAVAVAIGALNGIAAALAPKRGGEAGNG